MGPNLFPTIFRWRPAGQSADPERSSPRGKRHGWRTSCSSWLDALSACEFT
jgi:hypothetical protein